MRIIYRQPDSPVYPRGGQLPVVLHGASIRRCYFKLLSSEKDSASVLRRAHRHAGFEIHMILEGEELYEAENGEHRVPAGSYLIMPPQIPHRAVQNGVVSRKCAITFSVADGQIPPMLLPISGHCMMGRITEEMAECIRFILTEAERGQAISPALIGGRILEILTGISRAAGYQEIERPFEPEEDDPRLQMARQYIRDNISRPLSCDEVAEYCHLSARQLTRLFQQHMGVSPARYIAKERIERMEQLLSDQELTLREISESMHFSSEYYFNAFMKKNTGMTPGAYRKMIVSTRKSTNDSR